MRAYFGVVKRLPEKNNRATFRHSTDRTSHHPINPLVPAATSCSPRAARAAIPSGGSLRINYAMRQTLNDPGRPDAAKQTIL